VGGETHLISGFQLMSVPWIVRNQLAWGDIHDPSIGNWDPGSCVASATLPDAEGICLDEARHRVPVSEVPRPYCYHQNAIMAMPSDNLQSSNGAQLPA
jgi:hypothetical protein